MKNEKMTQEEMIKHIKYDMADLEQRITFNAADISSLEDEVWDHIANHEEEKKKQDTDIEKAIVYGVVLGWMASMLYLVLMIAAKVA